MTDFFYFAIFTISRLIAKRQADYISKLYEFHERKYEENRKQINRTVCDIQAMSRNKPDSESYGNKYQSKTNFFRNQAAAVTQEKAENKITGDVFTRVPTFNAKYNDKVVKKKSKTALDVNHKLQTYFTPRPTADLQLPIILSGNMEYVGRLQPFNIESINRIKKVLKLNQILLNTKVNAVPKQREHNPMGSHHKQNTSLKLDVLESYKKYETDYMTRKQNVIDIKLPVLTVVGENRDRVDSKLLIKVPSPLDSYRDGKTSKEVIDECITYFNENFSDNASVELNNNTNRVVTSIRKGDAVSKSKSPEKYFLKLQKKQCSCVLHTYKSPPPTPDVAYSTI